MRERPTSRSFPSCFTGKSGRSSAIRRTGKQADRQAYEARGVRYRMNRRSKPKQPLSERWRKINRARSRTRARGEHAFRIVKQVWGFAKVRYRGLAKNLARAQTMFALANLYQVRSHLLPAGARCTL